MLTVLHDVSRHFSLSGKIGLLDTEDECAITNPLLLLGQMYTADAKVRAKVIQYSDLTSLKFREKPLRHNSRNTPEKDISQ